MKGYSAKNKNCALYQITLKTVLIEKQSVQTRAPHQKYERF